MLAVSWIQSMALLILNLSLLAYIKIRYPESKIGSVINTIV
jgi:hypothetical protein